MSYSPKDHHPDEHEELFARLCNEDASPELQRQLNDILVNDQDAQRAYLEYMDLHACLRLNVRSLDHEDFALSETQVALDAVTTQTEGQTEGHGESAPQARRRVWSAIFSPSGGPAAEDSPPRPRLLPRPNRGSRAAFAVSAGVAIALLAVVWIAGLADDAPVNPMGAAPPLVTSSQMSAPAKLQGAIGARWGGGSLVIAEETQFKHGQRLDLVEGLADIEFQGGSHLVVQGPAILQIRDGSSVWVSVGRIATRVGDAKSAFTVQTYAADISSVACEFGAEVDVDGSVAARVYKGQLKMRTNGGRNPSAELALAEGEGAQVSSATGEISPLAQPDELNFVRFLPVHDTLINLADIVAGGDGLGKAYHRGVSLVDGRPVDDYSAPAPGDGRYHRVSSSPYVDGVFIPGATAGPMQIDSIGRTYAGFPTSTGDCWGGAIMVRRPREEDSLPFLRLEFHGNNYGYVNWLHAAGQPEELTPQGYGLIGMHSNCAITFDLHAIRAQHPHKRVTRFRALVGSIESKPEVYPVDAWVIVDGERRYFRQAFSREDGPDQISIPLSDRDRFLVLAVTDSDMSSAYDWAAFGDPVVEMTTQELDTSASAARRSTPTAALDRSAPWSSLAALGARDHASTAKTGGRVLLTRREPLGVGLSPPQHTIPLQ